MPSASQLRINIERQLSQRIPAALSPAAKQYTSFEPTGVLALDERISGLPVGALTEVTGATGSGRTTLAQSAVSAATRAGQVVAWVDGTDAFDPESAAANGVPLDRLLWVRCGHADMTAETTVAASADFQTPETTRVQHGGGSPHPRSEERGLAQAVHALLTVPPQHRRDRVTGTPGAANRPLAQSASTPRSKLSARIEQAGTDRQPSRRGAYVLEQREKFAIEGAQSRKAMPAVRRQAGKPWQRIDNALRVTDLLLQAGGFRIVVLDLADIAAEYVSRIPMATWFRFRAGAEHAQSVLLVLTQHASTGSSAGLVLLMHGQGETEAATYFPGLHFAVEVGRQRFSPPLIHAPVVSLRKPPQRAYPTEWQARTHWSGRIEGVAP